MTDTCIQCGLLYCNCVFISKQEYKEALEQEKKRKEQEEQEKVDELFREKYEELKNAKKEIWDVFITLKQSGEDQIIPCWQYLNFQDLFTLLYPDLAELDETLHSF